jgi:hypothetical protein
MQSSTSCELRRDRQINRTSTFEADNQLTLRDWKYAALPEAAHSLELLGGGGAVDKYEAVARPSANVYGSDLSPPLFCPLQLINCRCRLIEIDPKCSQRRTEVVSDQKCIKIRTGLSLL